jgi:hypothetical protein
MLGGEKLAGKELGVAFCADYLKARSFFGFWVPYLLCPKAYYPISESLE